MKKSVSMRIPDDVYEATKKIAYVQRMTVTDIVTVLLMKYIYEHHTDLEEYERLTGKAKESGQSNS